MTQPGRPPVTSGSGTSGPGPLTSGPAGREDGDWAIQAADTIERLVGKVRDKTSVPLVTVARALVFGLLAAVMALVIAVLGSVMLVRLVDVLTGKGNVWIAHLAIGGLFTALGAFLLRKAITTPAR
ncbi:MAG: hypothetical protein M3N28_00455 [Actinomycetota bacterium]|nr:hypothetical protein [Actinomycetota bacterium]